MSASTQFEKLLRYAIEEDDVVVYQMLRAYQHSPNNWKSWEEFLIDTIFAVSAVNKATREHLCDVLSKQPPPPYIVPKDNFVPDGAWSSDYK